MLQNYCTKDIIEKSSYLDFLVLIYICDFWKNNFNFWWQYLWHLESEGGTEIIEISNNVFKVCSINFLRWLMLKGKLNSFSIYIFIVFLNTVWATYLPVVIAHIEYFTVYGNCLNVCLLQWTVTSLKARTLLIHLCLVSSVLWARKTNSWRRFLSLHSASIWLFHTVRFYWLNSLPSISRLPIFSHFVLLNPTWSSLPLSILYILFLENIISLSHYFFLLFWVSQI